jgi:hypothetical protein
MPRKNLTHIVFIIDRSGSMGTRRDDTIGGFNEFIKSQKEAPGDCTLTLVQFDHEYEILYRGVPIEEVEDRNTSNYCPRGSTALLDAVGQAMVTEGQRIADMDEDDRPEMVLMVIQTDGEENCSREYAWGQISEMIKHQEEKYSWGITYLGAGADAIAQASKMGIGADAAAAYDLNATKGAFTNAGTRATRSRSALMAMDAAAATESFNFQPEDRKEVGEKSSDNPA